MKKIIVLFVLLGLSYSCKKEQNTNLKIDSEKIMLTKNDSSRLDRTRLNEYVKTRFSNTYKENSVVFNDGSTFDISQPLMFEDLASDTISFFPNLNPEEAFNVATLDDNGVFIQNNKYHPTSIGKIALRAIKRYKETKSKAAKKVFFDQMDWIENNFYETEHYGFWYFSEAAPLYRLDPGWPSVFSQGLLLESCLEAYLLTKEIKYKKLIEKALKGYIVPIENGGFMRPWDSDELWFEEYPTKKPSRVLNGTMYGLTGVRNVAKKLNSVFAEKIFAAGVETLINHLEDYDAKYTSRYSLADWKNEVSLEQYHEEHVIQLLLFYTMTKKDIFREYAKKFLESDRGTFLTKSNYDLKKSKIKSIEASYCIDCDTYGTQNLLNGFWSFGNFWSSHKKAELIVDLGEIRADFQAITLFHVSQQSKDVSFKLYAYNETTKTWEYVQQFISKNIKDAVIGYNKTGNFETFITHYKIFEEVNAQKLKLVFDATNDNIIALRELDFIFDRTKDFEHLVNKVEEWESNI
jgi:hypothetical protein